MRATVHDSFTSRVTPVHPQTGQLHIIYRDITEEGQAMGLQEVFPMDPEQALKLADEIKKKCSGIEVVAADQMPDPPDLRSV